MTQKKIRQLENILAAIDRAAVFTMRPDVHIVRETTIAGMPGDRWQNDAGKQGLPLTKEIGSDLCGMFTAQAALRSFIETARNPKGVSAL